MERFARKNSVIIGGTSGMGLAVAKLLLHEGSHVLITGHNPDSLKKARETLGEAATVLHSDATRIDAVGALATRVSEMMDAIDLLFINAGATIVKPFTGVTEKEYDDLMALNTRAPFFAVQKLSPLVRDGGAIVVTTSVSNVKGMAGTSVYSATKAAVRSMVRTWARELAPRRIRVNAVSPGPISTTILDKAMGKEAADQARAAMRESNPMKRFGEPEEVARAVAFLAFEATFTTGAELPVDGGASQL